MKPARWVLAAALATGLHAQAVRPWRGWDRYQVIMWSAGEFPGPSTFPIWIQRLKELGFTAEQCPASDDSRLWPDRGFGFYVDSMIPELGFHSARAALYKSDWQGYTTTRDKRFLSRNPSFEDPAFWVQAKQRVQSIVSRHAANKPLLYNLRDEPSLGSFTSPMDYSFSPSTLGAFRQWLQAQYGTLAGLNREWETSFARWDDVTPLTTFEIKDRERLQLSRNQRENYAPWADHRAFMDISFTGAIDRLRSLVHQFDPDTPVGIAGSQMPSAWGGYDLWRLSRAVDWLEPYDVGGSRKILASFLPPGAPMLATVFGSDIARIRRQLWRLALYQDRGAIVWDDADSRCIRKDVPAMPVTPRGMDLAPLFAELKTVAPKLFVLRPERDRIAIHYSQASIRAHWMLDSREDGDTWYRRLASYEQTHSGLARVRDSFARILEDLGLDYDFVSYEQVENDALIQQGYKVLILPQSIAMSARECRRIEAFVRAGGTVIADNLTAAMDEHCRRLATGQLDDLFGIRGSVTLWRKSGEAGAVPPAVPSASRLQGFDPDVKAGSATARAATSRGAPVLIENRTGKGRTIYLNLDMHDYGKLRLTPPQGENYTELFGRLLRESGVQAAIQVQTASGRQTLPGVRVWRYSNGDVHYVALMRNPEFDSELGKDSAVVNKALEQPVRIHVFLPARSRLRDLRTGRDFGVTAELDADLDPWSPLILELTPPH